MFVLFLGLLLVTLEKKPKSLVSRINNAFRMFAISEFVDEYEPSKYSKELYNEKADVNDLSVKIQLVKECVMSVLDFLKLDDATIQKVALAKVSNLMDAMDIFVAIAKEKKQPSILADLQKAFPDITTAETWKAKLGNADNVRDAVEFIKDTIHPDSVVNLNRRKQIHDEIKESNSEEQFEDSDVDQLEDGDSDKEEEKSKEKKSYRKKYGNFYQIPSPPARKSSVEKDAEMEAENENEKESKIEEEKEETKKEDEKEAESKNEDEEEDSEEPVQPEVHAKSNSNVEKVRETKVEEPETKASVPAPLRKSSLNKRKLMKSKMARRSSPRFYNVEQINSLDEKNPVSEKSKSKKERKHKPHNNDPSKLPFEDEVVRNEASHDNKKLDEVLDDEAPKYAPHIAARRKTNTKEKENLDEQTDNPNPTEEEGEKLDEEKNEESDELDDENDE